jgi:type II secretory pathway pseudopilin PulG
MKTPPILLKLLHNSAAKPSPNFNKTASRKSDGGFTIIELLVIVIMLGVLSAIAAPGWVAFINRQRARTVNDRVLQTLRTAQSEAKRTKSDRVVTFNPTPATDPPTAIIKTDPAQNPPLQTVTFNAGGEIKPGTITLTVNTPPSATAPPNSIVFDYQGNLTPGTTPFYVTVAPSSGGTKQCVIVETLLGGMRTAEGEYKPATKEGCRVTP